MSGEGGILVAAYAEIAKVGLDRIFRPKKRDGGGSN